MPVESQPASPPTSATLGTVAGTVVADNPDRTGLWLACLSGGTVSIGFGTALATINKGITLQPGGAPWEMGELQFNTAVVTAVASGTPTVIAIQEWT